MLLAAAALEPPRPTDLWVQSQQSIIDLQTCVTRQWARFGNVTPIPLQDGVALDLQMKGIGFGGASGQAVTTLEIHDDGNARKITILYRHPWSSNAAYGWLRDTGKRCFSEEWAAAALSKPQ
jgi:hypothetical protein